MTKKTTGPNAALLAAIAVLALGGGTLYFAQSHRAQVNATASPTPPAPMPGQGGSPTPGPNDSILPDKELQAQGTSLRSLAVYTVVADDNGAHLVKKMVPASAGNATPEKAAVHALNAMTELEDSPLPRGTKALSVTFGDNGVATVDFSKAFQDNFSGGDENEALTLNAVLATLGQFPGVKSVQFLVEGKKIDSLGGNESLQSPLPVPQGDATAANPTVAKGDS